MHKPVLLSEILKISSEVNPRSVLDVTFGRGGHTQELLKLSTEPFVMAVDQDSAAIQYGIQNFSSWKERGKIFFVHGNFHDVAAWIPKPHGGFDVILADLGVSSPQLDTAERGFSFYHDGPLDMRMNQSQELSAKDIIATWSEVELISLFKNYGEIRRPNRVVRAIVQDRKERAFNTTTELSGLIERVEGWRKKGHHPATTYFLALRMAVNNELEGLKSSVEVLLRQLKVGGRLIILTFHSLEDRIIKYAFKEHPELGRPLFKKVIVPSREECLDNPRARSAKLRVFERGALGESSD